ncbi:hypothetical protein SODALDRAFT_361063 [Sodiomyces alkalinus F11]|uniref:60S ribosomal protein L6 n=1 Tax=Sodiomyces alkalinus (strain CBS 110278 / VKM F-3762 / F11) TaxID=1314773 RepID=A0A3N2PS98_SODAK|nr:hypothetical protein SODALDRAFT_361063 [Sodiomyces alkalinus F11]ROT37358.1 hypothetical protein SODALDRAFT_361063 [Sodiomyces alkalinus F11]
MGSVELVSLLRNPTANNIQGRRTTATLHLPLSTPSRRKDDAIAKMSAKAESTTKKFGSGTREVLANSEKAQKWYPADDESQPKKAIIAGFNPSPTGYIILEVPINTGERRDAYWPGISIIMRSQQQIPLTGFFQQVRKAIRPWAPRQSLQPGTVLILLAGRFRGKRVVLLKTLEQGVLLVTGPFKINGVPLRRINSRYVIATSLKVDISGVDEKKIEEVSQPKYFTAEKTKEKAGEEAFFKQGEAPKKKEVSSSRAADQKAIDKALLANIKKVDMLAAYLATSFSLRKGDKPHEMKW